MFLAVGLLAAGFYSASLFGSPDSSSGGSGARGEKPPERLEPIDNHTLMPTSAPSTWDGNIAQATHTSGDPNASENGSSATSHQVARPTWLDRPAAPPAGTSVAVPEIRSQSPAAAPQQSSVATAWPPGSPATGSQFGSLAPPPLLPSQHSASAMVAAPFPDRPVTSAAESSVFTPTPSAFAPAEAPPVTGPSFSHFDAWNAPAAPPSLQPSPPVTFPDEPIWHVVADGDSLPKIAERYLRDATRAREVYNLNRDVLDSPDLLPIGTELRIPQTVAAPAEFQVFDASGGSAASYQPQSRLVPLPDLPASARAVPRAHLQGPVSASLAVDP